MMKYEQRQQTFFQFDIVGPNPGRPRLMRKVRMVLLWVSRHQWQHLPGVRSILQSLRGLSQPMSFQRLADGSKPAEKVPETSPPQSVNAAQDAAQKPVGDASADKEQVTSDPEQTRKALGIVFVMSCVHGHVL